MSVSHSTQPIDTACVILSSTRNHGTISNDLAPTLTTEMQCTKDVPVVAMCQRTGFGWWKQSEIAATLRTPAGGDAVKDNLVVICK